MWSEVKRASNPMVAEMWRDLFEGEGVPSRIVPEENDYRVLVPSDRAHLVDEILRKI